MSTTTAEFRRRAALELIERHDATLRRTARRYSLCAADGEDAYQRSLEILLTKAPEIGGENLLRWMQVVTRREAMAVRRQRERMLSSAPRNGDGEHLDPFDLIPSAGPEPDDAVASRERVERSAEALRALKRNEVRALLLKAEGYSYAEIGRITGWSYTKINRCMAEGRKRFFHVFGEIESGGHCARYADQLSSLADGELGEEGADLRLHLRSCAGCRAQLAAYRGLPASVLAGFGPAAGLAAPSLLERIGSLGEKAGEIGERGREVAFGLINRGAGEGAAGTAIGGAHGAGVAGMVKVLAVCGATAAGGAACVASGVVNADAIGLGGGAAPGIERPVEVRPAATELPNVPAPAEAEPEPKPPADEEDPPPEPTPPEQTSDQFGISPSSSASAAPPSPPPAGGGSGGSGAGNQFGFQ